MPNDTTERKTDEWSFIEIPNRSPEGTVRLDFHGKPIEGDEARISAPANLTRLYDDPHFRFRVEIWCSVDPDVRVSDILTWGKFKLTADTETYPLDQWAEGNGLRRWQFDASICRDF